MHWAFVRFYCTANIKGMMTETAHAHSGAIVISKSKSHRFPTPLCTAPAWPSAPWSRRRPASSCRWPPSWIAPATDIWKISGVKRALFVYRLSYWLMRNHPPWKERKKIIVSLAISGPESIVDRILWAHSMFTLVACKRVGMAGRFHIPHVQNVRGGTKMKNTVQQTEWTKIRKKIFVQSGLGCRLESTFKSAFFYS